MAKVVSQVLARCPSLCLTQFLAVHHLSRSCITFELGDLRANWQSECIWIDRLAAAVTVSGISGGVKLSVKLCRTEPAAKCRAP